MEYLPWVLVFVELGMIYGLVNRLVRQAGQRGMAPTEVLKQMTERTEVSTGKVEHQKRAGGKITIGI